MEAIGLFSIKKSMIFKTQGNCIKLNFILKVHNIFLSILQQVNFFSDFNSFSNLIHSSSVLEHILAELPEETLQLCFVGNYLDSEEDVVEVKILNVLYVLID